MNEPQQPQSLPSPFYRVTVKGLVFDERSRLLIIQNSNGNWELPGGGWEHDETFDECLKREVYEELGVNVVSIGDLQFTYRRQSNSWGNLSLRLVVPVTLDSHDFRLESDMFATQFVDKSEFLELDMETAEGNIHDYVNRIWPE